MPIFKSLYRTIKQHIVIPRNLSMFRHSNWHIEQLNEAMGITAVFSHIVSKY